MEYVMNQEWKFKLHSVYGQLLFDRKLTQRFEQVKANKGTGGIDGESIESYESNLHENIMSLLEKLKAKTYQAQPSIHTKEEWKETSFGNPDNITVESMKIQNTNLK
ncbi:hypothetical protein [Gottfriedia acidiceleris]|uniref:hypothetical protein n=1 Tax=Gottfriedia acidiceleris TaxID=371036 RepID=UPI00157BDF86|nr:hypothetical protein [Gottfriedia acidiceleris]